MSYVALYRKWRPDNFDEVKGQEHVVTTLKNQIKFQRIGHAYLFCGTRGTGKTTLAKIMAKAANCEHPVDGSPCNECESCRRIAMGQATNVVEIDAASNNGVDNIRQIQNAVNYSPSDSRYLVYIIDEVHMLSAGAFNALLKTLEEPPEYVIFILATTEAHKIPATISSRCQHYDFKRIPRETITDRLAELLERENVPATRDALDYIAGAADGSMRDALSILDQCIAFNLGEELTYDRVLETIGTVDIDIYIRLFKAIYAEDVKTALEVVDEVTYDGKDLAQFANDLIMFIRDVLLLKLDPTFRLELTSENIAKLIELGKDMDENYLIDCINSMQEAAVRIGTAYVKKVMLEVAIIKLCKPSMQHGIGAMEKRLSDIEKQNEDIDKRIEQSLQNISVLPANDGQAEAVKSAQPDISNQVAENIASKYPAAKVNELKQIAAMYTYICDNLVMPSKKFLKQGMLQPTSEESRLDIVFVDSHENKTAIEFFSRPQNLENTQNMISEITEKNIKLNVRKVAEGDSGAEAQLWDLSKLNTEGIKLEFIKN